METIKKYRLHNVAQTLIMIGIGLVLVVWRGASLDIMAKALAALLVLIGAIFIAAYFFKKEKNFISSGEFVVGIIIAAIGAWIFINPGFFTDFIPKLFGIFIIVSGLNNLRQTISLLRYKFGGWWISLIIAAITVGLGAVLLFKTDIAKDVLVIVIGAFLIVDGVTNLLNLILLIVAQIQKEKEEAAPQKQDASPQKQEAAAATPTPLLSAPQSDDGAPVFKVQILTSDRKLQTSDSRLKGLKGVDSYHEGKLWKYTVGASTDYNEIYRLRKEVVAQFPQAFIIAFKNGEKTDVQAAIQEFKKGKRVKK